MALLRHYGKQLLGLPSSRCLSPWRGPWWWPGRVRGVVDGFSQPCQVMEDEVAERQPEASAGGSEVLQDTYGRQHTYLRLSLTERCNLRCQYCMPEEGVSLTPSPHLLTQAELMSLVRLFCRVGVDKVRLTGGEPLVRQDIVHIVRCLVAVPGLKEVSLTTNGVTLSHKLAGLVEAGISGINISLDTLQEPKFEFITRRRGWSKVMRAIDQAMDAHVHPLKINCVVMKGLNDDEICDFVALTQHKPLDVRFIEYMPFSGNKWSTGKFVPYQAMLSQILARWPDLTRKTDSPNDTSKGYQVPGYKGSIGFITSMSQNFCSTCNRLRLTADGNLKVCLFGQSEVSLRDVLRGGASDQQLLEVIGTAVKGKKKQHAGMMALKDAPNRPMILIGLWHNMRSRFTSLFRHGNHACAAAYSTDSSRTLTHLDHHGDAHMVDVSCKKSSLREAKATGVIALSPIAFKLMTQQSSSEVSRGKGDVLGVARVAGIMAAKNTAQLIPLCHTLSLTHVDVTFDLCEASSRVCVNVCVRCDGVTGVEMEALTAVSVALLTVYDMTKAVSKSSVISDIQLESKTGGQSGTYTR